MHLVLLPGMHGSNALFEPFVSKLSTNTTTIELPATKSSDINEYAAYIAERLPNEPCVILAESFSGCLIPYLLNIPSNSIVAIIFVASFIQFPNRFLLKLCLELPNVAFTSKLLLKLVLTALFLNGATEKELLNRCAFEIGKVPVGILKARIRLLHKQVLTIHNRRLPTMYLQASKDRVVPTKCAAQIERNFQARVETVTGPHFLIQAQPDRCAMLVNIFMDTSLDSN